MDIKYVVSIYGGPITGPRFHWVLSGPQVGINREWTVLGNRHRIKAPAVEAYDYTSKSNVYTINWKADYMFGKIKK